ncbi:MAG: BlaI/MecI/CopY family transcriptional regulator [Thermoanaerobaculia bacterium]|nr:BlaI/MecI/CopY family transcriptional regulator [Thermoanaerobaculia bacterium]
MTKVKQIRPTEAELAILRVLWERKRATVRDVHEELSRRNPTGYTTVLKLMQIMTDKGLVERDESNRAHVYRPKLSEQRTKRQLVGDLLDRAFGGATGELVMQALSSRKASSEELQQIRDLLDELERKEGGE